MKKIISFLICLMLVIITAFPAFADVNKITYIECDISSNLVYNNSFEAIFGEAFWSFKDVEHKTENTSPIGGKNTDYEVISVNGKGTISNLGYNKNEEKPKAQITFTEGEKYDFSCFVKNVDFNGTIYVYLNSKSNRHVVTELDISNSNIHWKKLSCELTSLATEAGSLTIEFNGNGTLLLDFVQLIPHSAYGYGKEQYKYATIRSDFYNAITDLKPTHIAFSLDAYSRGSYDWASTIGPAEEKFSSNIGITEYFNLCEDINAELVPIFNIINVSKESGSYDECLKSILDLIEYANGDSVKTYWGAIRAADGHPEPYNLKYIAFADGADTEAMTKEINKKYKDINIIITDDSYTYDYISIPPVVPKSSIDMQTILLIAAPCAAVVAVAVIVILVVKKRKK